jgi:hypothetical protein
MPDLEQAEWRSVGKSTAFHRSVDKRQRIESAFQGSAGKRQRIESAADLCFGAMSANEGEKCSRTWIEHQKNWNALEQILHTVVGDSKDRARIRPFHPSISREKICETRRPSGMSFSPSYLCDIQVNGLVEDVVRILQFVRCFRLSHIFHDDHLAMLDEIIPIFMVGNVQMSGQLLELEDGFELEHCAGLNRPAWLSNRGRPIWDLQSAIDTGDRLANPTFQSFIGG